MDLWCLKLSGMWRLVSAAPDTKTPVLLGVRKKPPVGRQRLAAEKGLSSSADRERVHAEGECGPEVGTAPVRLCCQASLRTFLYGLWRRAMFTLPALGCGVGCRLCRVCVTFGRPQ